MYFVYIIRSLRDKRFYTGITDNICRRFAEHNSGMKSTLSTKERGPFELIHVEIVNNRKEARILEKYFKSGAGREIRSEIIDN